MVSRRDTLRPRAALYSAALNRLRDGASPLLETAAGLGFASIIPVPEDPEIARRDSLGNPLFCLPDSSPAAAAVAGLARELALI